MTQRKLIIGIAVAASATLTLSACGSSSTKSSGSPTANAGASAAVQNFGIGTAADNVGPATAVTGAKSGGTVTDIEPAGFDYLDPGQVYVSNELAVVNLYNRPLTNYKVDPKTGKTILVGDLATNTGTESDGGKTWTFTLRSGLKFQDGTAITSADVKYGVERLYADYQTQGPTYVPTWLSGQNYRKVYAGPASGASLPDTAISTPDANTIVFHLQTAHADFPYAAAMPNIGAIEKSKDTGSKYNNNFQSDGPYMLASASDYVPGKSLKLVRNPNWSAASDPIRNAYPDAWNFELGVQNPQLTTRLEASTGSDATALTLSTAADATQTDKVTSSTYASRSLSEYQPYVEYLNINMTRVTDLNVRKAIATAFPYAQLQTLYGGPSQLELGGTLISPTVGGWTAADPFNIKSKPAGDPAAAKALLTTAGKVGYKLVYAYANTPRWQKISVVLKNSLTQAGFDVVLKPIDPTTYYTQIGTAKNTFDIYRTGWGADWPVASTVDPILLDGRTIGDGSPNYSHYNSAATNAEIDRINAITNVAEQQKEWNTLAQKVIATDVPLVPFGYDKFVQVYGTGLGGVTWQAVFGAIDVNTVFVK
jgi:peptide/nickel transport system substrate-binding protein